jgi:hypothetical protein
MNSRCSMIRCRCRRQLSGSSCRSPPRRLVGAALGQKFIGPSTSPVPGPIPAFFLLWPSDAAMATGEGDSAQPQYSWGSCPALYGELRLPERVLVTAISVFSAWRTEEDLSNCLWSLPRWFGKEIFAELLPSFRP